MSLLFQMLALTPAARNSVIRSALRIARSPAARHTAYRAANTIYRAYRRYSARRRTTPRRTVRQNPNRQARNVRARIGMPVGSDTCRRQMVGFFPSDLGDSLDTRTLYAWDLTNISQGDEPNQRTRDIVNFRGIKICADFVNTAVSPPEPVPGNRPLVTLVRWAIVSPKYSTTIQQNSFFRSYGANRNVKFDHESLTYMDYYCRPLNIDAMHVITGGKFYLNNEVAYAAALHGKMDRKIMKYIPIKRQLRYILGDENVEFCSTKIYFICWCDVAGAPAQGTDPEPPIITNAIRLDLKLVAFFRNPKD